MKIILSSEAPQRSERWYELHIGRPTASEFHRVITPQKLEISRQRFAYQYRLAAERLLNRSFATSLDGLRWIEEGKEKEEPAIKQYQVLQDVETYPVSMILTDDEKFGCSPDRLIVGNDRHGLEIKAVFPPMMIQYRMEGSGSDHRIQVLGQMWIGELERNDLFAYNEAMPPYFCRWERSDVERDIRGVANHMIRFGDELEELIGKLNATGFFTRSQRPMTVLDQLTEAMVGVIQRQGSLASLESWEASDVTAANLSHLNVEQRDRVLGMVEHKKRTLSVVPGGAYGWGGC